MLADDLEPDLAPEVREIAEAPVRLDREMDLPGRVLLDQQEPLEPLLDVAFERVVAEAERGGALVAHVPDAMDPASVDEPESHHLQFQEDVPPDERGVRVEVADDDR